jgi:hypothetical protein
MHPSTTARPRAPGLAAALALLLPAAVPAQNISPETPLRLDYRLGFGIEHNDNILRTLDAAQSETLLLPRLAFALASDSERLSLQAAGDLEFRSYQNNSFDNELNTRLGLRGSFNILPQRLSWVFEDYLGLQPVDASAVDRPDNRQRTNVLVTGPTLSLRPSANSRLLGELRYVDSWAEETADFNSERISLAVRGLRQTSPRMSLSANLEYGDVEFDRADSRGQPYRRTDAYGRIDRRGARSEWSLDLGGSRIAPDTGDSLSGLLARARLAFEPTESSRIEARLSRQFADAVQDLVFAAPRLEDFDQPISLPSLRTSFLSADLYRGIDASVGYVRDSAVGFLRADAYSRELDYLENDTLDQEVRGAVLGASRQLRSNLALSGFVGVDWRNYRFDGREDRESSAGLALRWQWLRNLGLDVGYSHNRRDSDVATQVFRENRVSLTLTYTRR